MIAINHALTGALIGFGISQPLVAVPMALASHFVLDAVPHYGDNALGDDVLRKKQFALQLILDAAACITLVVLLALNNNPAWILAAACAFVATLPDFAWLPGYVRLKRGGEFMTDTAHWYMRFAKQLQWFERPIGVVVEIAWFIGAAVLLIAYL